MKNRNLNAFIIALVIVFSTILIVTIAVVLNGKSSSNNKHTPAKPRYHQNYYNDNSNKDDNAVFNFNQYGI